MSDNAIQRIQAGDLRKMSEREGLILQGCGGDPGKKKKSYINWKNMD